MNVFCAFDGDGIGKIVGASRLVDDIVELRRVNSAINAGNHLFESFCASKGGSWIEGGGDEGCFELPAEYLPEVPSVAKQYAQIVGATVSVGIGMKLSESSKALLVAKLRGKDRIVLWSDDMQPELEIPEKDERAKIADEYLNKSIVADPLSPPIEPSLEDLLHQAARERKQLDDENAAQDTSRIDELRQTLGQILLLIKEKSPVIAQLQDADPDAYQAILSLVQGVIALGKETMGIAKEPAPAAEQPVQKSEAGKGSYTYTFKTDEDAQKFAESIPHDLCEQVVWDGKSVHVIEATADGCESIGHLAAKIDSNDIDKSGSAIPGTPAYIHLNLPPGSIVNGKVRVLHGDGTLSWIQAGSGMIQATQDPDVPLYGANSHPASARRPGQN